MNKHFFTHKNLIKTLFAAALSVLLIFTSFLFYQHYYSFKKIIVRSAKPTSILTGVHLMQMNQQGKLNYEFNSPLVYDFDHENISQATKPVGYFYQTNQPPWKVVADRAVSIDSNQRVTLYGNVKLHQDAGKNNSEVTLLTEKMVLLPNKKIAYNDIKTIAYESGLRVTSIGFKANLKKSEVKLLSKARAIFTQTD